MAPARRFLAGAAACAAVWAAWPGAARACSCPVTRGFWDQVPEAPLVVLGRVDEVRAGTPPALRLAVIRSLKGGLPAREVEVRGGDGADCRPALDGFLPGSQWVLPLFRVPGGWALAACGGHGAQVLGDGLAVEGETDPAGGPGLERALWRVELMGAAAALNAKALSERWDAANPEERRLLLRAIGRREGKDLLPFWLHALRGEDGEEFSGAAAVGLERAASKEELARLANDLGRSPAFDRAVLGALAAVASPEAIPAIEARLRAGGAPAAVRVAAWRALLTQAPGLETVIDGLAHPLPEVRAEALRDLQRHREPLAGAKVLEMLEGDVDPEVRRAAEATAIAYAGLWDRHAEAFSESLLGMANAHWAYATRRLVIQRRPELAGVPYLPARSGLLPLVIAELAEANGLPELADVYYRAAQQPQEGAEGREARLTALARMAARGLLANGRPDPESLRALVEAGDSVQLKAGLAPASFRSGVSAGRFARVLTEEAAEPLRLTATASEPPDPVEPVRVTLTVRNAGRRPVSVEGHFVGPRSFPDETPAVRFGDVEGAIDLGPQSNSWYSRSMAPGESMTVTGTLKMPFRLQRGHKLMLVEVDVGPGKDGARRYIHAPLTLAR